MYAHVDYFYSGSNRLNYFSPIRLFEILGLTGEKRKGPEYVDTELTQRHPMCHVLNHSKTQAAQKEKTLKELSKILLLLGQLLNTPPLNGAFEF